MARPERVTFKYGLGEQFIDVLKRLHMLGLDSHHAGRRRGIRVSPRDVVAACLPDPYDLGDNMHGVTCAGTWVTGIGKDGAQREVYLYQAVDNDWSMSDYGSQAVIWQTAVNPLVALELSRRALGPEWGPRSRGFSRATVSRSAERERCAMGHGGAIHSLTEGATSSGCDGHRWPAFGSSWQRVSMTTVGASYRSSNITDA